MKTRSFIPVSLTLLSVVLAFHPRTVSAQGNLTPPGAPGPAMRSLDQVEPRTPISSLPYMITNAGSYYVTTNLSGGAGGGLAGAGIIVSAGDVSIDLNGFTLSGAGVGGGLEFGVLMMAITTNLSIYNGTFRHWADGGVDTSSCRSARLERLRANDNGGIGGIRCGAGGVVKECAAMGNSGPGISSVNNAAIIDCIAFQNATNGIAAGSGCRITGCSANINGGAGILAGDFATIKDCNAYQNIGDGFAVGSSCLVTGNHSTANANTGIRAAGGSQIDGNFVQVNIFGLNAGNCLVVRNSISGNVTNYVGTYVNRGPIDANAATSTNAWANF